MTGSILQVDVAIIGAGTAGAAAMREVRQAGKSYVLIDQGPLGTSCARVGCMPSKSVLHAAGLWQGMRHPDGAADARASELWRQALATRDLLVEGAAARTMAAAGDRLLTGQARFTGPDTVEVGETRVQAGAFVVATGSSPVVPAFLDDVRDRVLTTDSLFYLERLPASIGILGVGAIGLEMGLALARLGVRVVACDVRTMPGGITDPEIAAQACASFAATPGLALWLGRPVSVARAGAGLRLTSGSAQAEVECLLAALGRQPALAALDLAAAGIRLGASGLPEVDPTTMRAGDSRLYFAGDALADRPLQHEAADEGAIAGWNAARTGDAARFRRRAPLSIVFSDPDIASVGTPFHKLEAERILVGSASGKGNGRSRILGAQHNLVRVYAERVSGQLLGASIFATQGEHLAHLLAWAIQRGESAASLLEMPFYHPSVEEMLQTALADIVKQQGRPAAGPAGLRGFAGARPDFSTQ